MSAELRPLLFGDVPIDRWLPTDPAHEGAPPTGPWAGFARARDHLEAGDLDLAIREWSTIANPIAANEARHVLQAWTFLRQQGVQPDASIAGEVLGVVAEVSLEGGHDVLAAYVDGSIRYLHHLGGATIVEPGAATPDMAAAAAAWLVVGQRAHDAIGPWDGPQLPPLPVGDSRMTMLARGGSRFGQGPDAVFRADPLAGELFGAATVLLQAVVAA